MQGSIYSLTVDEFQTALGRAGKDFGSMNMDELLRNICTAEESNAIAAAALAAKSPMSTPPSRPSSRPSCGMVPSLCYILPLILFVPTPVVPAGALLENYSADSDGRVLSDGTDFKQGE